MRKANIMRKVLREVRVIEGTPDPAATVMPA
jgi:hypothetical protein